jgi:hypothetical protein
MARPVVVHEMTLSGAIRRTISLPYIQLGNQLGCTLSGSTSVQEGFGSISADGTTFHFMCYNASIGSPTFQSSAARVIARIFANGEES